MDVSEAVSTGIGNSKSTYLKLQLYPIPAEDFLTIKSEVRISRIVFYDMNGKVVKEINQLDPSTLNVSELKLATILYHSSMKMPGWVLIN